MSGAFTFPITKDNLEKGFGSLLYRVPASGLYYVALSNCGDSSPKDVKFTSGEMVQISRAGFLPAEEAGKLSFYLYLMLGYLVLMGGWFLVCSRWSEVLFKIHHYISITIAVGAIEAGCWYSLSPNLQYIITTTNKINTLTVFFKGMLLSTTGILLDIAGGR